MNDETLRLQAADEVKAGTMDPALFEKACSQTEGNDLKAQVLYIEPRVRQLKEEACALSEKQSGEKKGENEDGMYLLIIILSALALIAACSGIPFLKLIFRPVFRFW